MTKDQVVNATLLSVGTGFTGTAIALMKIDIILAVLAALVGFAAFGLREVLP